MQAFSFLFSRHISLSSMETLKPSFGEIQFAPSSAPSSITDGYKSISSWSWTKWGLSCCFLEGYLISSNLLFAISQFNPVGNRIGDTHLQAMFPYFRSESPLTIYGSSAKAVGMPMESWTRQYSSWLYDVADGQTLSVSKTPFLAASCVQCR